VREEKGREVCHRLDYDFRPVRLPDHPDVPLWLVVVRGLGARPMMLLTKLPMRRNRKVLWWAVSAYLSRWRIEEAIRFVKQSYDLEDIRVLTYERLHNMAVLVNAVAFFTAVVLGTRIKLDILATHLLGHPSDCSASPTSASTPSPMASARSAQGPQGAQYSAPTHCPSLHSP
jgi:hypothetical protein